MGGARATMLLVDRDALSGGDCRLLAHLGPDEPPRQRGHRVRRLPPAPRAGTARCRRLTRRSDPRRGDPADAALGTPEGRDAPALATRQPRQAPATGHVSASPARPARRTSSCIHRDGPHRRSCAGGAATPAARCTPSACATRSRRSKATSRSAPSSAAALAVKPRSVTGSATAISVTVLRAELKRVLASPIVLNRALREAVLEWLERGRRRA